MGKVVVKVYRPFEILERVSTIAYWLALLPSLSCVYTVFHVSMLWKYTPYLTHVVDWAEFIVDMDGTFEEGMVCIMDNRDQVLQSKTIRLVKVLWKHRGVEEAMQKHYACQLSFLIQGGRYVFSHGY